MSSGPRSPLLPLSPNSRPLRVDLPELPPAQLPGDEHARRLRRAPAEREHDRLLGALPAHDALLPEFDRVLGEFEA